MHILDFLYCFKYLKFYESRKWSWHKVALKNEQIENHFMPCPHGDFSVLLLCHLHKVVIVKKKNNNNATQNHIVLDLIYFI